MRRTGAYLLFLGGLTLFTFLIVYHGFEDVATTLAVSGWGVIWVALFHSVPLMMAALAWQRLLSSVQHVSLPVVVRARWIGESINTLLPVAQVGGNLAKARLIIFRGVAGAVAGGSVVVELTVSVATQMVFTFMGVCLLFERGGREVARAVLVGLIIMALLVGGFILAQRLGLFGRLAHIFTRFATQRNREFLVGGATALDHAILKIYRNRVGMLTAVLWRLGAWIVGVGEVWLALYFLANPVSIRDAFLLESLGQAVRAVAFMVPGALGVQEGGYLVLGAFLGLGPELSLALSLIKRVRELLLGIPGLIAWQITEGRHAWQRQRILSEPLDETPRRESRRDPGADFERAQSGKPHC